MWVTRYSFGQQPWAHCKSNVPAKPQLNSSKESNSWGEETSRHVYNKEKPLKEARKWSQIAQSLRTAAETWIWWAEWMTPPVMLIKWQTEGWLGLMTLQVNVREPINDCHSHKHAERWLAKEREFLRDTIFSWDNCTCKVVVSISIPCTMATGVGWKVLKSSIEMSMRQVIFKKRSNCLLQIEVLQGPIKMKSSSMWDVSGNP